MSARKVSRHIRAQRRAQRASARHQRRTEAASAESASAESASIEPLSNERPNTEAAGAQNEGAETPGAENEAVHAADPSTFDADVETTVGAETNAAEPHRGDTEGRGERSGAEGPAYAPAYRSRRGKGRAPGRVLTILGAGAVVAIGVGSFAVDLLEPRHNQQTSVAHAEDLGFTISGAQAASAVVCPPMPGELQLSGGSADEETGADEPLTFAERDDSASYSFRALAIGNIFDALPGVERLVVGDSSNEQSLRDAQEAENDATETPVDERSLWTYGESVLDSGDTDDSLQFNVIQPDALASNGAAMSPQSPEDLAQLRTQMSYLAQSGPVAGLATTSCAVPQHQWLFMGSETGDSVEATSGISVLSLTNPFDQDAVVDIRALSSEDEQTALDELNIVVPAEGSRQVNLAAITEVGRDVAVEVTATGASVSASLQTGASGTTGGVGTEFLPALQPQPRAHTLFAEIPEGDPIPPQLWVYLPQEESAEVELQVFGTDGQQTLESASVMNLAGGEVHAIDVTGLETGSYAVVVNGEAPVYSTLRSESAESEDFGFSSASMALQARELVTIPGAGDTGMVFSTGTSDTEASVNVEIIDSDGERSEPISVDIPAQGLAEISADEISEAATAADLTDIFAAEIASGEAEVYGSLVTTTDDGGYSQNSIGRSLTTDPEQRLFVE